jgi:hypothetical protein
VSFPRSSPGLAHRFGSFSPPFLVGSAPLHEFGTVRLLHPWCSKIMYFGALGKSGEEDLIHAYLIWNHRHRDLASGSAASCSCGSLCSTLQFCLKYGYPQRIVSLSALSAPTTLIRYELGPISGYARINLSGLTSEVWWLISKVNTLCFIPFLAGKSPPRRRIEIGVHRHAKWKCTIASEDGTEWVITLARRVSHSTPNDVNMVVN